MIAKSYIEQNLKKIERRYNKPKTVQDSLFFSKLAIMELCGWIEVSMDHIVTQLAKRKLKKESNRKFIDKQIIKTTYGFVYKDHFRPMLISVIGLNGVEILEDRVDPSKFEPMRGTLGILRDNRNERAHEYIKGTTCKIDAPSKTIANFYIVYDGLKDIEIKLRDL
jgi:hypothetical protein